MFEISGISLKLGLVDLHLGFLLGMDDDGRLGHVVVMFILFDLVMFMFFFPPIGLMFMFFYYGFDVVAGFDLHVL